MTQLTNPRNYKDTNKKISSIREQKQRKNFQGAKTKFGFISKNTNIFKPNLNDMMTWGPSGNVVYSSFAFKRLKAKNPSSNSAQSVNWSWVWSLKLPENILHFLWLTFHESLPNSFCNRCNNKMVISPFYTCFVWRFLRLDTNVAFYFGDLQHWLTDNIKSTRGMLFTATCWVIWKTCNAFIFGANTWSLWSIINQIQNLHMDIIKVWNHTPQHIRFVIAANQLVTKPELSAILHGLQKAWDNDHRSFGYETDSKICLELATNTLEPHISSSFAHHQQNSRPSSSRL
ncbi:hypothetical protein HKD37_20G056384 [Glycine soja]